MDQISAVVAIAAVDAWIRDDRRIAGLPQAA